FPKPSVAFADEHLVMALAAAGDAGGLSSRIGEVRAVEKEGRQMAGPRGGDVGEAGEAFARGDAASATPIPEPAPPVTVPRRGERGAARCFRADIAERVSAGRPRRRGGPNAAPPSRRPPVISCAAQQAPIRPSCSAKISCSASSAGFARAGCLFGGEVRKGGG